MTGSVCRSARTDQRAFATVYTYTGDLFTAADPPYTTGDRLSGAFETAIPIQPLTPLHPVDVVDWSFADGVVTLTPANSVLCQFDVATDAAGHIVDWSILLREQVAGAGDPQQSMSSDATFDQAGVGPAGASLAFTFAEPPYAPGDRVTGDISVAGRLPNDLPSTDITAALLDFSFTDGQETRTPADSVVCQFQVATDGDGEIVQWRVSLREAMVAVGDPQHAIDTVSVGMATSDIGGTGPAGPDPCGNLMISPLGRAETPGTWRGDTGGALPIPTLSPTAIGSLVSLLALVGLALLRRRG